MDIWDDVKSHFALTINTKGAFRASQCISYYIMLWLNCLLLFPSIERCSALALPYNLPVSQPAVSFDVPAVHSLPLSVLQAAWQLSKAASFCEPLPLYPGTFGHSCSLLLNTGCQLGCISLDAVYLMYLMFTLFLCVATRLCLFFHIKHKQGCLVRIYCYSGNPLNPPFFYIVL